MAWCEENRVDYLFGLARNRRLVETSHVELAGAEHDAEAQRPAGPPLRRLPLDDARQLEPPRGASSARPSGPRQGPNPASSSPR